MPTWVGIDIGSASVKVAVVRSTYRKVALVRVASAEVAPSGGPIDAVRKAVALALDGERQGIDSTAVAIEGSRVAVHRLTLPAAAQKQLVDVLTYELESQIPFDIAGAVFDWRLLERAGDDGQLAIIAAVARIDDVRACIDLAKEATSYEPERVGVGAFTLSSLVPYVPVLTRDESVAILDIGAKASEVLVLEAGEAVFARTLSTGTEGMPATAERLARELRVSFAAHRAQGGKPPTQVYLCGGGAFLSGAQVYLSSSLRERAREDGGSEVELPVQILPEPQLEMTTLGADTMGQLPLYAKAIALSLSLGGRAGMNLRRGPLSFDRGFAWVRERVPILAGLAAVILVSFVFSAWARLHAVYKERDALQTALGEVTKDVLGTEATSAQEAQELLTKETGATDEDPMPHADGFDVMVLLSQAIPMSMKHDIEELDVQKAHVTIRAMVGSVSDEQTIVSALSEDRCLTAVSLKGSTAAVGIDRQKYVIEFDVKCPEDVKAVPKKKGDVATGPSGAPSSGGGK